MMIGMPIMQLILFGFAINTDPKHLPTALVLRRRLRRRARSLVAAMRTPTISHLVSVVVQRGRGRAGARARATCSSSSRSRRTSPRAGARRAARRCWSRPTPPTRRPPATPSPRSARSTRTALAHDLKGALGAADAPPRRSSCASTAATTPRAITAYNIVPGLIGVILTMTMVMMTALAMTRERERGTMENLLAMPARPLEVMIGKIVPYIAGRLHAGGA